MSGAVDSHAHVFAPDLPFVQPRHYTPAYAATIAQFAANLDAHGLAMGMLIQPSFLGRDNSHMLDAMAKFPGRFRATVVLDPATTTEQLVALEKQGAVGVRFNLSGFDLVDFTSGPFPAFLDRLRERDWHVEIHCEGRDLPMLLAPLIESDLRVVIDHFGRPDADAPLDDPGFKYLLGVGHRQRVWVKISGAYRNGGVERGDEVALAMTPHFLEKFGPRRLLWGSDWPHTQNESLVSYGSTRAALDRWVPDANARRMMLEDAPAALFAMHPA
jgi:predicted TIM-barrel fold metal-dependent hydrolase